MLVLRKQSRGDTYINKNKKEEIKGNEFPLNCCKYPHIKSKFFFLTLMKLGFILGITFYPAFLKAGQNIIVFGNVLYKVSYGIKYAYTRCSDIKTTNAESCYRTSR